MFAGFTRLTFLVLLSVTTAHFVLVQFPDVANHVNVEIYCNVLMMLGIVYSLVRKRHIPTDDDYFDMMRPLLQLTLILVYSLAGFHKLNADFLTPGTSCVKCAAPRPDAGRAVGHRRRSGGALACSGGGGRWPACFSRRACGVGGIPSRCEWE